MTGPRTSKVELVDSWYVAVWTDEGEHKRAVRARLTKPIGLIPPPTITMHNGSRYLEMHYAGDGSQASIAGMFGVTQQTVSRWLDESAPTPAVYPDRAGEDK